MIVQRVASGSSRPPGTFLNTNYAAAWLVALLLVSFATANTERLRHRRIAWALAAPVLIAVFLTGSRGALLGLLAGTIWLSHRHLARLTRKQWAGVVALVLTVGGIVGWRQVERIGRDPFIFHRLQIWQASLDVAQSELLWGSGPGQFAVASADVQFDDENGALRFDRGFHTTHSDWLRPMSEFGVPAALCLLVAVGLTIREIRRRRRQTPLSGFDDGAIAALLAFSAQAAVDNPSTWPAVYLLAAALLGHLLRSTREAPDRLRSSRFAFSAAIAATVVATFLATEIRPTLSHLSVVDLPRGRLTADQLGRLDLAISRNPIHPEYRMRLAEHIVEGELDFESYAAAREHAEAAVRLSPSDGRYVVRLAGVERIACGRLFQDDVCRVRVLSRFADAARLRPTDAGILLDAAGFALAIGANDQARQLAQSAIAIEPNSVPAHLFLAEALLDEVPANGPGALSLIHEGARIAADYADERKGSGYADVMLGFDIDRANRLVQRANEGSLEPGS
jgi:uncharacterized integral membrane protein